MNAQLLLFEESIEEKQTRKIENLEEKCERIRKGQYAKITSLQKKIDDLERKLSLLESCICKGDLIWKL